MLRELGADVREVRVPADLEGLDGLVMPGGESTTMTLGIEREGLAEPLRELVARRHAGARHLRGDDHARPRAPRRWPTTRAGATRSAARSAPSRPTCEIPGIDGPPVRAVFIRAPWIAEHGDGVEVLAAVDGHPVAARQDNMLVISFHPEIAGETRAARAVPARGRRARREPRRSTSSATASRWPTSSDRDAARGPSDGDRLSERGWEQARGSAAARGRGLERSSPARCAAPGDRAGDRRGARAAARDRRRPARGPPVRRVLRRLPTRRARDAAWMPTAPRRARARSLRRIVAARATLGDGARAVSHCVDARATRRRREVRHLQLGLHSCLDFTSSATLDGPPGALPPGTTRHCDTGIACFDAAHAPPRRGARRAEPHDLERASAASCAFDAALGS